MTRNEKYDILFNDSSFNKEKAFDQIAELFYDRNFSSTSKSEIELLMFSFYMEAVIKNSSDNNGVLNYNASSDYEIGKQLGITQEKVKNLKIKKQARYPVEFDWKLSLKSIEDNIRYDRENKKIIIPLIDPNLNREIRNFININGGFVEYESGNDHIKIRVEFYLQLMYYTLECDHKKAFIDKMKKVFKDNNMDESAFETLNEKLNLATNISNLTSLGLETVNAVVSEVCPENTLAKILLNVIKTAMKKV